MAAGLLLDDAGPWRFAVVVTLAVAIEEAVRWWLYTIDRYRNGLASVARFVGSAPPPVPAHVTCWSLQAHGTPPGKNSNEEPRLALQSGRSGGLWF